MDNLINEESYRLKIISGGQTGVDRAALHAAQCCGLQTGGWLPKNCLCLDGFRRDLLDLYGMLEHKNVGYPPRTKQNVFDSDATVRFATNWRSAGEKMTLNAIRLFNKPYYDIKSEEDIPKVVDWMKSNNFSIVNFAGNSETTSPGIYDKSFHIFVRIFAKFGICPGCNGFGKIYGERLNGPTHLPEDCNICC